MIQYQRRGRSRHKPSSLSLRSRGTSVVQLIGWVPAIWLSLMITPAVRAGASALLSDYLSTPVVEWFSPQPLTVTIFIVVLGGGVTLMNLGIGAILKALVRRERLRLSTAGVFYPGPGLRYHPRLES